MFEKCEVILQVFDILAIPLIEHHIFRRPRKNAMDCTGINLSELAIPNGVVDSIYKKGIERIVQCKTLHCPLFRERLKAGYLLRQK